MRKRLAKIAAAVAVTALVTGNTASVALAYNSNNSNTKYITILECTAAKKPPGQNPFCARIRRSSCLLVPSFRDRRVFCVQQTGFLYQRRCESFYRT